MANSKPSKRKTPIDLMREQESMDKRFYGLQRQLRSGSTTTITSNVGSGGKSTGGAGIATQDNLGDHQADGILNMDMFQVKNVATPTECNDAVTKCYVDDAIALLASINGLQTGGSITNNLIEEVFVLLATNPGRSFEINETSISEEAFILLATNPGRSFESLDSISENTSILVDASGLPENINEGAGILLNITPGASFESSESMSEDTSILLDTTPEASAESSESISEGTSVIEI